MSDIINLDEVYAQPGGPTITFSLDLPEADQITLPLWGSVEVDGGWLSFVPPSFGPMKIIGARTVDVDEFVSELAMAEAPELTQEEREDRMVWEANRLAEQIEGLIATRAQLKAGLAITEQHELTRPARTGTAELGNHRTIESIYQEHPLGPLIDARIAELREQMTALS